MSSSIVSVVTPSESERDSWDQQPHESTKAFQAFTRFRDAGWDRRCDRVAAELKKSQTLIYCWSRDTRGRTE